MKIALIYYIYIFNATVKNYMVIFKIHEDLCAVSNLQFYDK